MPEPILLLLAAALIAVAAVSFALYVRERLRRIALATELEWTRREQADRLAESSRLREELERLRGLAEQRAELAARLQEREARLARLEEDLAQARGELAASQRRESELAVRLEEERRRAGEKLALLEDAARRLGESFENLAQRIFEEKLARFTQQGGERIDQLLRPLREELGGFRQLVETGLRLDAEQRGLLRGELEQMRRLNERLSAEAEGLARALRGEFRTRGLWGELVLERVLESAGLERGREYELQRTVRDEEGGRRRPDAVVYLPEGRQVLIDAKAPLAAFLRACEAAEEESRRAALAQHARALKEHLRELGGRGYEAAGESGTVEMVLLFVPSEAALAEALREDPSLQTEALERRIALVGPNTLLAMLRAVSYLWKLDAQSRNARKIAREAGALYDKFVAFVEDLDKIGEQLAKAAAAHQAAWVKLSTGRGNLVARAERLRTLGATPKRALPPGLAGMEEGGGEEAD